MVLAVKLGIEKYINFVGARKDVDVLLKDANLFVMSSLDEGLPISAIEALRAKLPLILTNVGGNKELIRNNGYLVTATLDDMTTAIEKFASNTEEQSRMSENSYQYYIDRFSVENMISDYCGIFRQILSEKI